MVVWDIICRVFGGLVAYVCVRYFISGTKKSMLKTGKSFFKSIDLFTASF